MWKTKAGWHSTKKLDLRLFYQVARLKITLFNERFWFWAYSTKISLAWNQKVSEKHIIMKYISIALEELEMWIEK